jgi:hypothetical protein
MVASQCIFILITTLLGHINTATTKKIDLYSHLTSVGAKSKCRQQLKHPASRIELHQIRTVVARNPHKSGSPAFLSSDDQARRQYEAGTLRALKWSSATNLQSAYIFSKKSPMISRSTSILTKLFLPTEFSALLVNNSEYSQVKLSLSPKQSAKPKTSARKTGRSMPHCVARWVWLLRVLRSGGE